MNKISIYPKSTLRISKYNKRRAVSDVVAVLILIVIAIIGAVAVGLILSNASHSVGTQAANNGNGSSAETELLIGGSTTIFPVTQLAAPTFQSTYHVNLIDAQGGSGAGMQGVISGALDIGAASSSSAVYAAVTYITSNSIQGVTINPTLIGGSGIVFITNTVGGHGAFISDPTPSACNEFSSRAIFEMYNEPNGQFAINAGACATGILDASGVVACGVGLNCFQTYGRGDNSGTQDTVTGWLTGSTVSVYPYANSVGETGNAGLLSAVQACKAVASVGTFSGCVGFVDIGFAKGAPAGVTCPSGWAAGETCGVALPEATSFDATVATLAGTPAATVTVSPVPTATCTTTSDCFLAAGSSTSALESLIEGALSNYANINPTQTANPTTNVYPDSGGSLARSFYYVTNGTPTPLEQEFLNYMTSPSTTTQAFFTNNGYYSVYQFSKA